MEKNLKSISNVILSRMFTLRTVVVTQSTQVKQRKKTADQHFIRGGEVHNGLLSLTLIRLGFLRLVFSLGDHFDTPFIFEQKQKF